MYFGKNDKCMPSRKIPLSSGGFLLVEDHGNPYDALDICEDLYKRSSDGMTKPEVTV